jgi:hypothetical protein
MNKLKLKDLDRVKVSNNLADFTDGLISINITFDEDEETLDSPYL